MAKETNLVQINGETKDAASKIDTIRNLIFGEHIEEYNSEFETLKNDILEKKKMLGDLIAVTRQELTTAIDNVATDVNIRITELEDKLDDRLEALDDKTVDKKMLGDLLVELGKKISHKKEMISSD